MSLSGKLDRFTLGDLLQLLAISARSGKLTLSKPHGRGLMLLRCGKVVYAADLGHRQPLGSLLICRDEITEEQLRQALEVQNREGAEEKRLGTVLVELGMITQEVLEEVIRGQTLDIVRELMAWRDCYFRFERLEVIDLGEIGVDVSELVLGEGMSSDSVLLALADDLDAQDRETEQRAAEGSDGPSSAGEAEAGVSQGAASITLGAILDEVPAPQFTGEIASDLLHYSSRLAERVAFFLIRRGSFEVVGQAGCDESLRGFSVPRFEPSLLHDAAERMTSICGAVEPTPWNDRLVETLGGERPAVAVAAPVVANGLVVMLVYADALLGPADQVARQLQDLVGRAGEEIESRLAAQRAKQRVYLASS